MCIRDRPNPDRGIGLALTAMVGAHYDYALTILAIAVIVVKVYFEIDGG